jgi:sRNA-binding carbon storage regulator CsrA
MGRNNPRNIKIHNDKLHQKIAKQKQKELARKEKIKAIVQQFQVENLK